MVELFIRDVGQVFLSHLLASVVDQDVHSSEDSNGGIHHFLARGGVLEISGYLYGLTAGCFDECGNPCCVFFLFGQVGKDDVCSFPGESDGCGGADTRVRSGDDRLAAFQASRPTVALFTKVCLGRQLGVEAGLGLVLYGW